MSPRIMKVAVPLPKPSAMFGQEASSHTVCRFCSRRMCLSAWKREFGAGARTRIQAGLASGSRGTILIGMRSVLARPFSLIPASRMLELPCQARRELGADFVGRFLDAKVARLRHRQPGTAAGVDR